MIGGEVSSEIDIQGSAQLGVCLATAHRQERIFALESDVHFTFSCVCFSSQLGHPLDVILRHVFSSLCSFCLLLPVLPSPLWTSRSLQSQEPTAWPQVQKHNNIRFTSIVSVLASNPLVFKRVYQIIGDLVDYLYIAVVFTTDIRHGRPSAEESWQRGTGVFESRHHQHRQHLYNQRKTQGCPPWHAFT